MDRPLRDLALLFLRLGVTAFGGPAAHVALMQREVVERLGWLTRDELLDLLGAASLVPGPNSTELAIHIGHRRAGFPGLLVAGACFIVPAALITLAFAWAYVRFGARPEALWLLYGVKPVIVAVVVHALVGFARAAVKDVALGLIGVAALAGSLTGANELAVLLVGGALSMLARSRRGAGAAAALAPIASASSWGAAAAAPITLGGVFLAFAKIGAVLFGSGYVLLAFLRADLVEARGWLTEGQLLDAIAVGQLTPGPVFTTATFVGYLLAGTGGAAAATLGIFAPAFVYVAISGPLVPRIRRSKRAGAFLDGVNVASLGLMAAVTWELGHAAIVDLPTALFVVVAAVLLFRTRVSSVWLIALGAAAGAIAHLVAKG